MTKIFFVLFSLGASASFAADLSISSPNVKAGNQAYLVNSATQSCYMQTDSNPAKTNDVPAKYFRLQNFSISWPDTEGDVYISLVQATFQGGVLAGPLNLSGNELASLNGTHGQWTAKIPRATLASDGKTVIPSVFTSVCPMTFGGISIPANQNVSFQAPAQIQIIGVRRDSQGNEQPLTATMPFTIINVP